MQGMVPNDPHSNVSNYYYAIIYAPRSTKRKRFPASSVTCVETQEKALQQESHSNHYYAAIVHGPSKSSEGQFIYYLQSWLTI